ncbi:glycosyltransferase [Cognatiluteimonas telluris]|jgi:glycosyltransferase involved in cell wall biosynthesis|uniref:glycosyltransferase n=1 Tax=Cognatiluteimonas telluris TaxID=1104775 RepID=UPI00140C4455|nr:glycosyltransferase [Lysobacter telluris]
MNARGTTIEVETVEISDPSCLRVAPVVSVLMLVYNHGEYLAQAIESVLAQQAVCPVELLIGEDCSADNSRDIAIDYQRRHPESIRVITAGRNVGAHWNYTRLLNAARGEFIAHLDGDDYWLPGKLARQVALLRDQPHAVATYCNALVSYPDGATVARFNDIGDERIELAKLLRRGNFLCMSTMMFRSTQAPTLRGIGREFLDYQVHLTHAQNGDLLHIGEPLAVYRMQSSGSMVAKDNARVREMYWQAIQSIPRERVSDDDFANGLADFLRRVFFRAVRTGNWRLVREWTVRVLAASPYGTFRTGTLLAKSIARIAGKEAIGRLSPLWDRHAMRVLYRC